ncbi:MAG TPA: hypothetical protein VFH27_03245 [Longimicrobiaceae bacterium]|nr:hypothetical protein [Longimicrobiaceae bacterium]
MILHFNYEELRALTDAGEWLVEDGAQHSGAVAAPPEGLAKVERLLPRLTGDISIETLDEQRRVRDAVGLIVDDLHDRMDTKVIEYTPGHEDAVNLYFDYAHARVVLDRLDRMGTEMASILELIGGSRSDADLASNVNFPD